MASLLTLCCFLSSVLAQAPRDPIKDFCRRYGHQTAVIDRKLYIDGGWLYANPISLNPAPTINQGLLYGSLDTLNVGNFPTVYANLTKNNSVPDVAGGVLWADEVNKVFWLYGGQYSNAPSTFQLWGYDTVLNIWNSTSAATDASSTILRAAYGAGTTMNDLGRGYYYGGYLNNLTTPLWSGPQYATNGLIVFDMDKGTLTNKTGPSDGIGRAEGVMVSLPASALGMLAYFGGVRFPYGNTTEEAQSMEYILLYDIGDERWFTQRTTGQIPPNRRRFCGGVTWAQDKSSFNIYIYGGFGFGENATGFDDVYILTMPSFQWIRWVPDAGTSGRPHGMLSCNVIQNSQMIVMGGNFLRDNDCDAADVMGMHNLNLGQNDPTNAMWYKYLPNVTTYNVPPAVTSAVGGSATGGATVLTPPNGWSDSAIKVYFNDKAVYAARTPTRSLPAPTNSSNSGSDKTANLGAIVGGAVGGSAVIIAAVVAFWWFRRRNNKKPASAKPTLVEPAAGPTELHGTSNKEKDQFITRVSSSPLNPHSPGQSSYSTDPLISSMTAPGYPYQHTYPPHDAVYQQYYPHPNLHQNYPVHPPYGYAQYPPDIAGSPPEGWRHHPHHSQQYFPGPNMRHGSPPVQEMPAVTSPSPLRAQSATFSDNGGVSYHTGPTDNTRNSAPIRRREVGSTSSPTATTATYSDRGSSRV